MRDPRQQLKRESHKIEINQKDHIPMPATRAAKKEKFPQVLSLLEITTATHPNNMFQKVCTRSEITHFIHLKDSVKQQVRRLQLETHLVLTIIKDI